MNVKPNGNCSLLVIDDDERMRDSLRETLMRRGYDVTACADGPSGIARFQEGHFDVVLCDLRMPGLEGTEVCSQIHQLNGFTPLIVITAFGSVETAVEAMRRGAFDYITKPFKTDELEIVIDKARDHARLLEENRYWRSEAEGSSEGHVLVGKSPAIGRLLELVERYAASPATVLIRGESGTGKELVARALHQKSQRRDRPFICVNCAALSAGLLESELFGHERGAFTGADRTRQGRFEIAEGGTLLLDEVSEIDLKLQAKLLRVLQEKTFERVGSSRSLKADVRVLATSNRKLEEEVRQGRFREDLFFRLNVLFIEVPPLCQRLEDIPLLAGHFLEKVRRRSGGKPKELHPAASSILEEYSWPGNVRELENVIERAWVLTDGPMIGPAALTGIAGEAPRVLTAGPESLEENLSGLAGLPLRRVEELVIQQALQRHGGHQKNTAFELGIGVRTLRSKMKLWKMQLKDYGNPAARDAVIGLPRGLESGSAAGRGKELAPAERN
ncbi:MAG: sigma-54-dependent Fis family transcriptional regulator [Planctomycetes bacterium]|nr:sigma-54-dependent Fis family transcriptional regulator [Planctomycetota bacterium]